MVDPPTYRAEPDPDFADRLERVLLQRLTAPAGTSPLRGVDIDPGDPDGALISREADAHLRVIAPSDSQPRSPRRWILVAAAAAVIALVGTLLVTAGVDDDDDELNTVTSIPTTGPATNGWIALDSEGDIYLVRPGEDAHRFEIAGSDTADDACPSWSPDGTRLSFGRLTGASDAESSDAELVIVPVGADGAVGAPDVIALDGFGALPGFDPHPCTTWSPDGRWVAFVGSGDVWVTDTRSGEIRRLPDLRPTDLEWRPGTDELAIAGDIGPNRSAETSSTPVTVYTSSTGELRQLGSVRAALLTWSPDGSTLAYRGGENDRDELRLVDADGSNERLLAHVGSAVHGLGPVWSPTGERIAYQRLCCGRAETHEVVLVDVADGHETVIEPPQTDGPNGPVSWYPYFVTWSPDGTTLLYAAWNNDVGTPVGGKPSGLIAVLADTPTNVVELSPPMLGSGPYDHPWFPVQMWGAHTG